MLNPGYILKDTYVVDSLHARGGMALVYRVHHMELGVIRALKVLQPQFAQDENFVQRFRREAQIMAQLRHPNIAEVYDFGTTREGWLYLIMEWLDGEDLQTVCKQTPQQSFDAVAALSKQIAAALTAAHAAGVIHRDLKPGNVLLCRGPVGEQLKVVDFGIARLRSNEMPETLPGVVMGTPGYMAPEQLLGRVDEIDARSDQFALAVMLYEMLLGDRLFRFTGGVEEFFALALRIKRLELPPLPIDSLAIRSQVQKVLRRGMASTPASRFATIAEFDLAFREALTDSSRTPSISVELMPTRRNALARSRAGRWLFAAGFGIVLIAFVATAVSVSKHGWHFAGHPSAPPKLLLSTGEEFSSVPVTVQPIPHRPPSIPFVGVEVSPACRHTPNITISVAEETNLSTAFVREAQNLVKQCLRSAKIDLAMNTELVLERTNYLHVMSSMDILDKNLLEHCLQAKFTRRPPRRILVKRTITRDGSCNGL